MGNRSQRDDRGASVVGVLEKTRQIRSIDLFDRGRNSFNLIARQALVHKMGVVSAAGNSDSGQIAARRVVVPGIRIDGAAANLNAGGASVISTSQSDCTHGREIKRVSRQ